jgi:hypothetical protein
MTYANPFLKVAADGHFGSTTTDIKEKWSAGFHLTGNFGAVLVPSAINGFLVAITPAVLAYHGSTSTKTGSNCFVDGLTAAYIGTDGHYVGGGLQPTSDYRFGTSTPGNGTSAGPWSQALVITLRSLILRGGASHGRCYWPATAMSVTGSTGLLTVVQQQAARDAAQTMFNAVNTAAATAFGSGWNVGLVSQVGGGIQSPAIRVGIGARLDSMESREKDLPEAYQFANLTVSTTLLAQERDRLDDIVRDELEDLDDVNRSSEHFAE